MADTTYKQNHLRVKTLYVHVPFCKSKCTYCDFYSVCESPETMHSYAIAAGQEFQSARHVLEPPLASVFFGGGTPTCLPPQTLAKMLSIPGEMVDDRTEFTVEANPASVSPEIASVIAQAGVNRVSLGVQSFQSTELKTLGRIHTPSTPAEAIEHLRHAGVTNISVDLIYAIPGQTPATWRESLRRAVDLGVTHMSCYALSIEPNTPLGLDMAAGRIVETDENTQHDMYYTAREFAEGYGLQHYEISNFARPGSECRQNLTYWRNESYLGIGPAAASYVDGTRWTNIPDLAGYIQAIEAGKPSPCDSEHLTGRKQMAETVMLALRMTQGLNRKAFIDRFGKDVAEIFPLSLRRYESLGALRIDERTIRVAPEALFASDTILADVLAEA